MNTARVVVRLKPRVDSSDDSVQPVAASELPTLLIRKNDREDGVYKFSFTDVLQDYSQAATYQTCGYGTMESVLKGYNATIMAYGQTGAGKTYTMTGSGLESLASEDDSMGVIPRALWQLFRGLKGGDYLHWRVRLTYLEIYNDAFRDLLCLDTPSSELAIADVRGIVTVRNARYVECKTVREALDVVKEGHVNRQVACHNLNTDSSRSHTILSVWVDVVDSVGSPLSSKLNLVDLAGSERFAKTGTDGVATKEAVHINKSLTFLEQTVIALARKRQYVPFRSSKLTHFLKDSIGGNCKTLLIACVWSDAAHVSETLSTCRFAQRMMQVTENAQKNSGGLSSVHGSLFKLDPVMQQYLESMTAAAVAKEKAQLYAEFARLRATQSQEIGLTPPELLELEALRSRVKELELQSSLEMKRQEEQAMDLANLQEMSMLRRRVMQLENDMASCAASSTDPLPQTHKAESQSSPFWQEKPRSGPVPQAYTLQGIPSPTLTVLPARKVEEGEYSDHRFEAWSGPSSSAGGESEVVSPEEEECIADAAVRIHSREARPAELKLGDAGGGQCKTSALTGVQLCGPDSGHLVATPGSAKASEQISKFYPSPAPSSPRNALGESTKAGDGVNGVAVGGAPSAHEVPDMQNLRQMEQEPDGFWHSPSDLLNLRSPSEIGYWDPDTESNYFASTAFEPRQKKQSFIARLFSRRNKEHESFAHFRPAEFLEEEAPSPNIVILNSLNHNQLLELLKARPLKSFPEVPEGAASEAQENWVPITPEQPGIKVGAENNSTGSSEAASKRDSDPEMFFSPCNPIMTSPSSSPKSSSSR